MVTVQKSLEKSNRFNYMRFFGFLALLLFTAWGSLLAQTTYYSRATGNWNSSGTWSTVAFGDPTNTGSFPVAGDIALIGGIGYTITVNADAACASVSVGNNSSLVVRGVNFTVSGATTIGGGASGSLMFDGAVGTKTFGGLVTINAGGIWSNANEGITFQGGLTNNGSFTSGSGNYLFKTNSQTLTGTLTIDKVTVNAVALTNTNILTVNTLQGSGQLTQASNAVLNLGGTSTIANLLATASGNAVNYIGGAQTVHSSNYHHLTLSGSGVKTLQAGTTSIAGNLTLSGSASTTAVAGLTIGGSVTIGTGTSFTAGIFSHSVGGNWTNNGTFTGTGSLINFNGAAQNITGASTTFNDLQLSGNGTKALSVSTAITGTFSIDNSAIANLSNSNIYTTSALVLAGAVQATGTWGSSSSAATNQNDTFFSGTGLVTVSAGNFTYYSRANGDWGVNTTWSTSGFGGLPAAGTPGAGDFVVIGGGSGRTVTVTTVETCAALSFDAGTSVTNTLTISNSLSVSGAITIPQTVTSGSNILNVGAGNLTAGDLNFTATGSGAGHQVTISTGTATINGSVTGSGPSSAISFSGAGLLQVSGSMFTSASGTLTTVSGSTVEYNGAAQTIESLAYNNLTLSGSGNKILAATTTIGGNLNVGSGTTFTIGGVTLAVVGSTAVDGTLSITGTVGTKTFVGLVTVNGTWSNATEAVTIQGGITNNGTFTAGTGNYTFNTNSQTLTGSLIIPTVTVTGAGIVLNNTNSLTVSTSLQGTGRLTQGSNAILNLGGGSSINNMTATALGNTVNYTGAAQTVNNTNFYHLNLSGSGVKTLQAGTTSLSGNLTLSGSVLTTSVAGLTIGGSVDIGSGTSFTAGNFIHNVAGNWINNGVFIPSGSTINFNGAAQSITGGATTFNNLQLSGSGAKTLQAGTVAMIVGNLILSGTASTTAQNALTIGGSVSIGLGTSFTAGAFTHAVGVDWNNVGTFTGTGSTINFNGPGNQSISGFSTFNNLDINSAGTVSLTSSQDLVGLLSLGATSSFDAGAGFLTLISTSDTQSASIGEIQSLATFNGSIRAQRFMGAEGSVNRYVSSPVTGALLSDLISNFAIVNDRAQDYTESDPGNSSKGYHNVNPASTLISGRGYLVKPTAAFGGSDITWDVTGPLTIGFNQGDVNLNVTHTNNGSSADGWNLVGNPYPSAIVWDGPGSWDIQDMESVVYVPYLAGGLTTFATYDYSTGLGTLTGGVIASGQAFWVKAQGPGLSPNLVVHESAKTPSSGEFYRRAPIQNNGLSITLSDGIGKDISWLMTKLDALDGYDAKYDRSKLEAPALSISFVVESRKLLNSTIHTINDRAIPLSVYVGSAGEFNISFEEIGSLPEFNELFLVDKELGNSHKISSGSYTFTTNSDAQMSNRFFLSKNQESDFATTARVSIYPNPVMDELNIKIFSAADAKATVRDMSGVILMEGLLEKTETDVQSITFDLKNLGRGIYLIHTQFGGKSVTRKIFKN